jgi:ABC-type dipeptide/oligopeptide/nickel transport system ATPase component
MRNEGTAAAVPLPDPTKWRTKAALTGEVSSLLHHHVGCEFHMQCAAEQGTCQATPPPYRSIARPLRLMQYTIRRPRASGSMMIGPK